MVHKPQASGPAAPRSAVAGQVDATPGVEGQLLADVAPGLGVAKVAHHVDQRAVGTAGPGVLALALLAGAALGLSGLLLQRVLRNPIADPSTLGVAAGAQLALTLATLYLPAALATGREAVAFAGGSLMLALIVALNWRRKLEPVGTVLSVLLLSLVVASLSAALTLANGDYVMSLFIWGGGTLSQESWLPSITLGIRLAVGVVLAFLMLRPLTVLGLAEESARSLGVGVGATRLAALALANLIVSGQPWGVVYGLGLWGAKAAASLGVDLSASAFWSAPGNAARVTQSVLTDITSLTAFGTILGAMLVAFWRGGLAQRLPDLPARAWVATVISGLLLGYSSRLAFGCNVGALFSGISTGSLHGWAWLVMGFAGSAVGVRLRPWLGMEGRQ